MDWSDDFHQADWIVGRLHPFARDVGSIVPDGFPACARVEHPDVIGSLEPGQLSALSELLATRTSTPDDCWFALWDGYGWVHGGHAVAGLTLAGTGTAAGEPHPGAVPEEVRAGGRVRAPGRDYVLHRGPIGSAGAFLPHPYRQTPNLWWPRDHAWCVASEIDFSWTYVAGSQELVDVVVRHPWLEARLTAPTDPIIVR